MNETDNLFSPRQIAQIKLANSKIRASLQLDEYDYGLDERNLRKAIENLSLRSESSTDSQQHKALRSEPRSQLVVALSDLLSPVGVAGLLIAFALGSLGTLALKSSNTAGSESLALRSAAEVALRSAAEVHSETLERTRAAIGHQARLSQPAEALDPAGNPKHSGSIDRDLRALITSSQFLSFEIASEDPISLRSNIIESGTRGGLTVLAINEGGSPSIIVMGLDAKSTSQVGFRALAGIPLEVSGGVRIRVVQR